MNETSRHPLWHNWFRPAPGITTEIAELWAATPLFRGIPQREVLKLADSMQPRIYQRGEAVFKQGDLGAGAVLILEGEVSIRTGAIELARMLRGDFFGEVALVSAERRTAFAIADAATTRLVFLMQAELEEWIDRSPRQGAHFALNLASVLADRLRRSNDLVSSRERDHG